MATTTNLNNLATPGVYIQEIPVIPQDIVSVPTAVPVFVGYTQTAMQGNKSLAGLPFQIESMLDYINYFGTALPEPGLVVTIDNTQTTPLITATTDPTKQSKYLMYYAAQLYFDNGGSMCYILSIGPYSSSNLINGQDYLDPNSKLFSPVLEQYTDITLVVCPDALGLPTAQSYYSLQNAVLAHCFKMLNRMAVMDVYRDPKNPTWQEDVQFLRNAQNPAGPAGATFPGLQVPAPSPENFKYGAVYFPRVLTTLTFNLDYTQIVVNYLPAGSSPSTTMAALKIANNQLYYQADNYLQNQLEMLMPVAPAMVGIYASIDDTFGVWKAPANTSVTDAVDVEQQVSAFDQGGLNVDPVTGMSINAIRSFPGRGPAIVWGARTLAGNDNEWRYISVRRFFFMVEQSIKDALEPFVFETNDVNTWTKVTAMISTYLTELWRQGALMGTTTKDAFVVQVGLGITMTQQDVLDGRMIVLIQLAVVRPAEFIVLQFEQLMPPQS
jgi:uncharacterized protein